MFAKTVFVAEAESGSVYQMLQSAVGCLEGVSRVSDGCLDVQNVQKVQNEQNVQKIKKIKNVWPALILANAEVTVFVVSD